MKKIVIRVLGSLLIIISLDVISGLFMIPDDFQSFRTQHYFYHHGLLPNQNALAAWGGHIYPVTTNSLGFVDSACYKVQKKTDNHRILILGDSHSEGVGVPYLSTFSGRLATSLAKQGIEVLNASAVSYSQKTEFLKAKYLIEKEGLQFDELFLLIDISDLQNEIVYRDFNPEQKSGGRDFLYNIRIRLKQHSTIWYLSDAIKTQRQKEAFLRNAEIFNEEVRGGDSDINWDLYAGFFSHFDDKTLLSNPQFHGVGTWMYDDQFEMLRNTGIELGQQYILKLDSICKSHAIKLTISVHPWQRQIKVGDPEDLYVKQWETFSLKNGISFVNLFPLFITGENAAMITRHYYITGDNHWNEFGHQRVAAYLEEYFLQSKEQP